jgi:hypothetical protein
LAITFTQSDLDALKEALLTGALEVQIGERRIRYRSQAEILQVIKAIQTYLDGEDTSEVKPNRIQATFSKGES